MSAPLLPSASEPPAPDPLGRASDDVGPEPTVSEPTVQWTVPSPAERAPRRRGADPVRLALLLVAILAGATLFMGGYLLGGRVATSPGTPASEEQRFEPFWDVFHLIGGQYAGSPRPSDDQLVQAAIKGMMESLNDPYSYYQPPDEFQSSLQNAGGQAEGIGVVVQLQPVNPADTKTQCTTAGNACELAVVRPIPGSPAAKAGILAGDVISAVNGASIGGLAIDKITPQIKGPKGTTVRLTIQRAGQTLQLSIVRDVYDQPEVEARVLANGAVEYLDVAAINPVASSQFKAALGEALAAGRRAFILDLRDDPGGYVSDATAIASEFLPDGLVAYQQDAAGQLTPIPVTAGGRATDPGIKVVVLVNKNSASAAEILAGALQARGRARLVGETTFGKGIVQAWVPLPNNLGGVHLTVARWLTPNRVWINKKGLTPDVAVSTDGARAGSDPVLDAALQQLGYPPAATTPSPAPSRSSASPSAVSSTPPATTSTPTALPTASPSASS